MLLLLGQGGFSGVCALGLRVQPPNAAPAVPEGTEPLEMSPEAISSDGEQPQTPPAGSPGPGQGSAQLMALSLEWFSGLVPFVLSQLGGCGSWMGFGMRAPAVGMGSALVLGLEFHFRWQNTGSWAQLLPARGHFGSLEQHIHPGTPAKSACGVKEVSKHPGILSAGTSLGF